MSRSNKPARRKRRLPRRGKQLAMAFRTRGGKRRGAGRKRTLPGPRRVSHRARPRFPARVPLHVTTRVGDHVPYLRNHRRCRVIRDAMYAVLDDPSFRICQFSVQADHLHLICEADDADALAKGVKRFKQRVARGFNRLLRRKGSVFFDRYHLQLLRTPRQVRACLAYVLNNARKHGEELSKRWPDPFSSAWYFDGWRADGWRDGWGPPPARAPVARAENWLLRRGWKDHGLIGVAEVPGGRRARNRGDGYGAW